MISLQQLNASLHYTRLLIKILAVNQNSLESYILVRQTKQPIGIANFHDFAVKVKEALVVMITTSIEIFDYMPELITSDLTPIK